MSYVCFISTVKELSKLVEMCVTKNTPQTQNVEVVGVMGEMFFYLTLNLKT